MLDTVDDLYDENEELKEKVAQLTSINISLEKEVRKEMADEMMAALKRKEKAVEERMQIRIDFLIKQHADEVMTKTLKCEICSSLIAIML